VAAVIHGHDAVERGLEHRGLPRLAVAHRRLRAGALELLPELMADRGHQVEQVVVGVGDRLGEELDHADHAARGPDRERERAVDARLGGRACAREVLVTGHVADPGRLAAGPDAPGEPDAALEGGLPANGLERLGAGAGRVPGLHAAEPVAGLVHLPYRSQAPVERRADRLEHAARRVARGDRLAEAARDGALHSQAAVVGAGCPPAVVWALFHPSPSGTGNVLT
jgi:hypothetical protein